MCGFQDGLRQLGVAAVFHYLNADGHAALLPKLAAELAASKPDLIFACSTPAAQAAKNLAGDIPVVFTPVFDPVGAGLVADLAKPDGKVTGVSGMVNAAAKVDFIKKLLPDAKTVGILFQTDDANSRLETFNFTVAGQGAFNIVKLPVNKAEDLSVLPDTIEAWPDALFLPIGRIVEENFPTIFYYAESFSLPVIASHGPNVPAGALGALVANHHHLGGHCAVMAAEILRGKPPANIPVRFVENPEIFLNISTAASLNIKIPAALLAAAKEIFE